MAMPLPSDVFKRLIDDLESAASCTRQLAFLRGQPDWLKVDERLLLARKQIIEMYEAQTKLIIQGGRLQ